MDNKLTIKEEQMQEALARLKSLKLDKSVATQFSAEGKVFYSERQGRVMRGILYWLDNNPKYVEAVTKFEERYGAVVYHCALNHTEAGTLLSCFYVSKHKEEWEMDRDDLNKGYTYAYVCNLEAPEYSEIGSIQFEVVNGGVDRVA